MELLEKLNWISKGSSASKFELVTRCYDDINYEDKYFGWIERGMIVDYPCLAQILVDACEDDELDVYEYKDLIESMFADCRNGNWLFCFDW